MITSWHEVPFLRPFLFLITGSILFDYIQVGSDILTISFFLLITLQFILFKKRIFQLLQSINVLILIILIAGIRVNYRKEVLPSNFATTIDTTTYFFEVQIIEEPKKGKRFRAISQVNTIGKTLKDLKTCNGKLLIYFPEYLKTLPKINQKYLVHSRIQRVVNNTNPEAFDWKAYLYNRGVSYQVFLKENQIQFIGIGSSNTIMSFAKKARYKFQNIISKYVKNEDHQGIAFAMILGYKNKLNEDLYDAYTDTGAVHTLAVSGLHVGIIASILGFIFGFLKDDNYVLRVFKAIILIVGIWFYALLTGAAPAIIRAAIMFTIMIFDFYWSNNKNMINSLGAAGFFMILIDPYNIYQAGFQFSFLALAGILIFYPHINKLIPYIPNKFLRYSWGLVAVSIAAQITVFPITVYYFHKFPSYFWISGVIAIPLAFVILSIGVSLIISDIIFPYLSPFFGDLLSAFIGLLNSSIKAIQNLPFSNNDGLWLGNMNLMFIYMSIILIVVSIVTAKKIHAIIPFTLVLSFFIYNTIDVIDKNNQVKMVVYDIYGGTVIDFIDGTKVFSFSQIPRKDDSEKFMCDNFRLSVGMTHRDTFEISNSWNSGRLFHHSGYILSKEKTIAIASDNMYYKLDRTIDYLMVTNSYSGSPYKLLDSINPETVIIDKSMEWDRFYKWKRILKNKNIKTLNIFNEGATIINL